MAEQELTTSGMYKDVFDQPDSWSRLIVESASWRNQLKGARNGLLVGMGSSHYAALAAQFALMRSGGIWLSALSDNALRYLPANAAFDRVVAISQSGNSSDTVAAAQKLADAGANLLAITNTPGSKLAQMAQSSIDLGCGEEKGSSTKTYTTTVLTLLRLAGLEVNDWLRLPNQARTILNDLYDETTPQLLAGNNRHYFLGAGPNAATALEAALICKEKLYLAAEGMGAADFAHGPLEAVDENSVVWFFSVSARLDDLLLPMARRAQQTGAKIVVIGEGADAFKAAGVDPFWSYTIQLDGPEELGALLFILPMQLLVLWETARRGYPIDTFKRMGKVMTGYDYGLADANA